MSSASLTFADWGYRHASRRHYAVRDLNLTIRPGERVLLLGASGIGKSTILEGAAGLLGDDAVSAPEIARDGVRTVEDSEGGTSRGSILVDGVAVHKARGDVGLVLQDPDSQAIFQRLGDNVAFGPENMNVPRPRIWPRVADSLAAVGLEGLQLHRSTAHLSGGQMQRLALAGALAMRPKVLLLDEPTANLDPDGVHQIVDAVTQVVASTGCTMMLVEHRAGPWIDLIDRVVVLGSAEGEDDRRTTVIVADGAPGDVFTDRSLNFEELGIWLPERYRGPHDRISRIRTDDEPDYPSETGRADTLLSTRNLSIGRNGKAIARHIDMAVSSGQITAVVGENGAGKSTLGMTLAGLLEPVDGEVVASTALQGAARGASPIGWKSTELASRISYVFQNPEHQFARGSVLEEVMLGPLRTGMDEIAAKERALGLLDRFNLRRYAHVNPYTLSGGEKRRLTVASALASAPRVLILDEPTFGQDRTTWMQIVRLIHGLRADEVSIIVITHDRELVTALGARIVELRPHGGVREWAGDGEIPVSVVNERDEDIRRSSRSPFLSSLNPAFRLIGAFAVSMPMLLSLDWVSASVALSIEVVALLCMGFGPWRIIRSSWPIFIGAPGSALAVLLYGKSGGAVWLHWGMIMVTDRSANLALATGIRILAIGIPAIIAVLGIDATDLADSFSQVFHLPDRFVYGGLAGMRLFSVLQDDWTALTASRRSRGLGDDGTLRSFFPQAFALLVLSIRRSTMLATAMQARGFGGTGPRSHARVSVVGARDGLFVAGCLIVPCVALWCAYRIGSFALFGG